MSMFLATAEASEFLADVVIKGGMMSGDGKVWVKGHKSRQEMGSQAEKMILIMDMDRGYHWTLVPDMKVYQKTKIPAKGKGFHPITGKCRKHRARINKLDEGCFIIGCTTG